MIIQTPASSSRAQALAGFVAGIPRNFTRTRPISSHSFHLRASLASRCRRAHGSKQPLAHCRACSSCPVLMLWRTGFAPPSAATNRSSCVASRWHRSSWRRRASSFTSHQLSSCWRADSTRSITLSLSSSTWRAAPFSAGGSPTNRSPPFGASRPSVGGASWGVSIGAKPPSLAE